MTGGPRWLVPVSLFLLAFAVRLAHILSIADLEWFDVPLIDGINYFRTANTIASGDLLAGTAPFWQPPLYPYFLAGLIALFGQRMIWIYGVQAVIGSLSCVMTWAAGRRVLSPAAGAWAGGITALYGPLIYFDAQPLIPVVHIALTLAGLLLVLRAAGIPDGRRGGVTLWALAGLCLGLAAIATANLLLVLPVVAFWTWRRTRPAWGPLLVLLSLAALPVFLVAARNLAVSGEPVLISSNAGINLFIGNNPDYERTVHIRPGGEFEALAQQPENQGILSAAGKSRYFARRALAFLSNQPGVAASIYFRKLGELIAGREVPRNEDLYGYREHSPVLRLLLWRAGISFPFGLVAPLALAGMLISRRGDGDGEGERRRAGRRLLLGFLLAYAATILIFFPTGRYRLPLVPALAVFAGGFVAAGPAGWRKPAALAGLAGGLVLFNLDAFHPSERWPEEEALNRAYALQAKGRTEAARREYERARALDPRRIDPHNSLAVMAAARGDWEAAAAHYQAILQVAPDFAEVRRSLGLAYHRLGRVEEARRQWERAVAVAPAAGLALADLCMSYRREDLDRARELCERALAARPDLGETHLAMAYVAQASGEPDRARREIEQAVRLFPEGHPSLPLARRILERMPDP